MHGRRWLCEPLAGLLLLLPAGATAQQGGAPLHERVERLERMMSSRALLDLVDSVQRLQTELRELRGEVEEQTHTVEQLKQRQRELYLDIDRRMRRVEAGGGMATVSPARTETVSVAPRAPPATLPSSAAGTPPTAVPTPGAPTVDPVKEQAAYQRAFDLLKEGRYEQAAKAFKAFLAEYPAGDYADNAQYWLGEAYYVTRQFQPALVEFQKLAENYPASSKLTHAMLKMGYIYDEMGQAEEARKTLHQLTVSHPKTTAARLASERLRRMKQEGR